MDADDTHTRDLVARSQEQHVSSAFDLQPHETLKQAQRARFEANDLERTFRRYLKTNAGRFAELDAERTRP